MSFVQKDAGVCKAIITVKASSCCSPYNTFVDAALRLKEQRTHRFSISHSQTKYASKGSSFSSPVFTVGGHDWALKYYPQGSMGGDGKSIGLYLTRLADSVEVTAVFTLTLLDRSGRSAASDVLTFHFVGTENEFGCEPFATRAVVEECVKNDDLVMDCDLTVYDFDEPDDVPKKVTMPQSKVLQTLWESKDLVDVSFLVDGEMITAHRLVLAASSPVFKAMLLGTTTENQMDSIPIVDMEPSIFKAMLHYIYTNSLPDNIASNACTDKSSISVQYLLQAADKYALDRLKFICEEMLCRTINSDTVASTLSSAHQHSCGNLKAACLKFLLDENNFVSAALTPGFIHLIQICPEVLAELRAKITEPSIFQDVVDRMSRLSLA